MVDGPGWLDQLFGPGDSAGRSPAWLNSMTIFGYAHGCRCAVCCEASTEYSRWWRARKRGLETARAESPAAADPSAQRQSAAALATLRDAVPSSRGRLAAVTKVSPARPS